MDYLKLINIWNYVALKWKYQQIEKISDMLALQNIDEQLTWERKYAFRNRIALYKFEQLNDYNYYLVDNDDHIYLATPKNILHLFRKSLVNQIENAEDLTASEKKAYLSEILPISKVKTKLTDVL